jgi:methyl-accepting chemotaxis protein
MDWIDRLTVKQKLRLLSAMFITGFVLFALFAYQTRVLVQVNGTLHAPIKQLRDLMAVITPSALDLGESRLAAFRLWEAHDRAEQEQLIRQGQSLREEYDRAHEHWAAVLQDGPLKQKLIVDAHRPALAWFEGRDQRYVPALLAGNRPEAKRALDVVMRPYFMEHRAAMAEAVRLAQQQLAAEDAKVADLVVKRSVATTFLGIAILGLCVLFAAFISRSITSVLAETIGTLSSTSSEMASTIEEHERTAMSQSTAIHETTTTMDELEASFNHTAAMVQTAAEKARLSVGLAEEGLQAVQQTLAGMEELKEKVESIAQHILGLCQRTGQIGSITTLVSDLASQTNMLALNAAVEAARAGEHGRGFAVVAAEIRKLADESRKSAEQIAALVAEIQKETNATVMVTEAGTKTVDRAIQLAQKMVHAFEDVTSANNTASEATQQTLHTVPQQVTAAKQVLTAMESLQAGAQETASGISQTRAGADNVRDAAGRLKSII